MACGNFCQACSRHIDTLNTAGESAAALRSEGFLPEIKITAGLNYLQFSTLPLANFMMWEP